MMSCLDSARVIFFYSANWSKYLWFNMKSNKWGVHLLLTERAFYITAMWF
jgi:hypothetical protein